MHPSTADTRGHNLDPDRLFAQYRLMLRIRAFEEAAIRAAGEKLVLGAIHPSIGQEAAAVGVVGNLRREDILLSTHRGHGHTLAKGAQPEAMMRELFGRQGGNCGGKGGSMHIADFSVGMLGANGVVAANIPIAVGAAHALKLRGDADRIVCCIFGDGAINRGPFLEGLNWATVFELPVLFVCEDNGFAASTRTTSMTGGDGPLARARALGIPGEAVDGNDVAAVDEVARRLVGEVREHRRPRFLHVQTYRLTGHTAADAAPYRAAEEVTERWKQDPVARCRDLLLTAGRPAAELDAVAADADAEFSAVYEAARAAPWPDAALAFADVQDVGDPRVEPF